jgi:hypothetical protein
LSCSSSTIQKLLEVIPNQTYLQSDFVRMIFTHDNVFLIIERTWQDICVQNSVKTDRGCSFVLLLWKYNFTRAWLVQIHFFQPQHEVVKVLTNNRLEMKVIMSHISSWENEICRPVFFDLQPLSRGDQWFDLGKLGENPITNQEIVTWMFLWKTSTIRIDKPYENVLLQTELGSLFHLLVKWSLFWNFIIH